MSLHGHCERNFLHSSTVVPAGCPSRNKRFRYILRVTLTGSKPPPSPPLPSLPRFDRLKGELHESVEGANEVFGGTDGEKCRCHWALPVPARFPAGDAAARVFGYCVGRDGGGARQRHAVVAGLPASGAADDMELAEFGGRPPDYGVHCANDAEQEALSAGRGGAGGAIAEGSLRRAKGEGLEERLGTMTERDGSDSDGSAGRFR